MGEKSFQYDVFISYASAEPDAFVAQSLQKRMEGYRLPGNVAKKLREERGADTQVALGRVFRNAEATPDIAAEALREAAWMIVICSPRSRADERCQKEIETFVALRGQEHVLAVLAEGEPADSFPEALLYREVTEAGSDGQSVTRREAVEPLAADCRGENRQAMVKNMKGSYLKMLAPLFGLSYDDLKQRQRERRMRRIMIAATTVTTLSLLFGAYILYNTLQIHKKNQELEEKNQTIEEKNKDLLKRQALRLAEQAEDRFQMDDRLGCMEMAYQALTTYQGEEMPYTDEARYALMQSVDPYRADVGYVPLLTLEMDGAMENIMTSPSSATVAIYDSSRTITLWQPAQNKVIKKITCDGGNVHGEMGIVGGRYLVYGEDERVVAVDLDTGEMVQTFEGIVTDELVGVETSMVCFSFSGTKLQMLCLGESNRGEVVDVYDEPSEQPNGDARMAGDVLVWTTWNEEKQGSKIHILDTKKMKKWSLDISACNLQDAKMVGNRLCYVVNLLREDGRNYDGSLISCFELSDGQVSHCWNNRSDTSYARELQTFQGTDGREYVVVCYLNSAMVLDKENGETIYSYESSSALLGIQKLREDVCIIYAADGKINPVFMFRDTLMKTVASSDWIERKRASLEYMIEYTFEAGLLGVDQSQVIYYNNHEKGDVTDIETWPESTATKRFFQEEAVQKAGELGLQRKGLVFAIVYDDRETYFYVSWSNGDMAVYAAEDARMLYQWQTDGETLRYYLGTDREGNTYVAGNSWGYCLSPENQRVADIKYLYGVDAEHDGLVLKDKETYYTVPICSKEQLLAKAKEWLEVYGREAEE